MSYEATRKTLDTSAELAAAAAEHVGVAQDKEQEAVEAWQEINAGRPPEQDRKIDVNAAKIFEVAATAVRASTEAASLVDHYAKSRLAMGNETPVDYAATPHHTPARTEDRPQAPSNAEGNQTGNSDEQATNTAATAEETPTGRPSLLPTYTPMDVAAELVRLQQWRDGEAIPSINEPTASISLTAADRQLLEAYIQAHPNTQYFAHQQGVGLVADTGRMKKFTDPAVQAAFTQTANAMHSHMQYDLNRAGINREGPSVIHLTVGQFTTGEDSVPHMDAFDISGDNLIRYVVTPVGPTTQFAQGTFAPSEFHESGDMKPTSRQIVWASSMPKHITRFRGPSVHQAPAADQPTPRVFMSSSVELPNSRKQ